MRNLILKEFEVVIRQECEKCKHQWFPRSQNPQRCPRCQTWLDRQKKPRDEDASHVVAQT